MSPLYSRGNAIIPIACAAAMLGSEGTFYKLDATGKAIPLAAATDVPHGLVLATSADGLEISAAVLGGNHGPCRVKVGTAVADLRKDLTVKADGSVQPDVGTGTARVMVARPLELGAVGEQINAVLIYPQVLA